MVLILPRDQVLDVNDWGDESFVSGVTDGEEAGTWSYGTIMGSEWELQHLTPTLLIENRAFSRMTGQL